jgi:hypothetical protein
VTRRRRAAYLAGWSAIALIGLSLVIDKLAGQLVIEGTEMFIFLVGAIGLFVVGRLTNDE